MLRDPQAERRVNAMAFFDSMLRWFEQRGALPRGCARCGCYEFRRDVCATCGLDR